MEFLKRLEALNPDLAADARREIAEHEEEGKVARARRNLADACDIAAEDATGQDYEDEVGAAAQDYCDAQDARMKRLDPDRWAEIRMGA